MKKINFSQKLLDKYLTNECTAEEKAVVEGWYNKQLEQSTYKVDGIDFDVAEKSIWQSIQAHRQSAKVVPIRRVKTWYAISAVAACILVLVIFRVFVFQNNPVLLPKTARNAALIPAKENNLIQLSDGTMIILDKNSKLEYPKSFKGKKTREVYLTGKAFFDIHHNPLQPFIVHAGKIKTTVLGTAFDIIANPGSGEIVVRVIRGKVNVATKEGSIVNLLPNKKVTYYTKTDESKFATVNAKQEMQWTSQNMLLNDITFSAICLQLEKRYDTKILIADNSLKDKKFTISLGTGENLDDFLKTICEFNDASFRYDKAAHQYTITAK